MAYGDRTNYGDSGQRTIWPYSSNRSTPNRMPYLPQPPLVRDYIPTQLGNRPYVRPLRPDEGEGFVNVIPGTGMSKKDATRLYLGLPQLNDNKMVVKPKVEKPVRIPRAPTPAPRYLGGNA